MNSFIFYSLLEGFHTSLEDYHKASSHSFIGRVFKLFSNFIFENFYPLREDGWATMPCMLLLKIFLTCAWKRGHYELYTWPSYHIFQLVSQLIFSCLYTHLCFSIYVCFKLQIVSISIGIHFFIHIYMI